MGVASVPASENETGSVGDEGGFSLGGSGLSQPSWQTSRALMGKSLVKVGEKEKPGLLLRKPGLVELSGIEPLTS